MNRLRVGIVGAGFGAKVHAPAFSLHERFDVVAIASPSSAERAARERKIPHAFASTEAMLAGVELDVLAVASPPFDHHRSVMAALAAGKHVLCEKPFALTVAEAEAMAAAAARAGVVAALGFEFRYLSAVRALGELVANGHLGALRQIEVAALSGSLREANTGRERGWWFERSRGGGIANAWMPHLFDLATQLAGRPPQATFGFSRTANTVRHDAHGPFTSDVADGVFAVVEFAGGIAARVSADATSIVESTTIALHGERRSAIASGPEIADLRVYVVGEEEQDELEIAASPYARHGVVAANVPLNLHLLDAFAAAIDLGAPGVPTFADGLGVQRQLAAVGYGAG